MEDRSELLLVTPPREKKVFYEYKFSAKCTVKGCDWKREVTVVKDGNIEDAERNFIATNEVVHREHKGRIKVTRLKD